MKAQPIADLYADYLLASFGATTATGLSQLLEGEVSHEQVTRYVAGTKQTATALWWTVKSLVRPVHSEAGGFIIDDAMEEKPDTDEHAMVGWHYDHAKARVLTGIHFLPARDSSPGVSVPVGFHWGAQTEPSRDPQTQKENRRSPVSTQAVWRELINQAGTNRIPFRVVLFAVGCAAADPRVFITPPPPRAFLCPLPTTRKVALRRADKHQGR
jgi:DDE superfamily endonuclease